MNISSSSFTETSEALSRAVGEYRQKTEVFVNKPGSPAKEQRDQDTATLSQEGRDLAQLHSTSKGDQKKSIDLNDSDTLDRQEVLELQKLKQRDVEVRTHEQAHLAAAGKYSRGGASFTYQKGPDGASYAVGGEVGIDTGKEKEPEETISKMQTIRRAALAPASPSAADRSIAARASIMESQARQEILMRNQENLLHADFAQHPDIEKAKPSDKQEFGNGSSLPPYNTLRVMIATYQRVAKS